VYAGKPEDIYTIAWDDGISDAPALARELENRKFHQNIEQAKKMAFKNGKITIGKIQREFKVGFATASRMLDSIERDRKIEMEKEIKAKKKNNSMYK
jgi:hypothetical protein